MKPNIEVTTEPTEELKVIYAQDLPNGTPYLNDVHTGVWIKYKDFSISMNSPYSLTGGDLFYHNHTRVLKTFKKVHFSN